jgi:hypothetical protein
VGRPIDLWAVPFILDDVVEGDFTGELRGMAHSLNVLLTKLNSTIDPYQV